MHFGDIKKLLSAFNALIDKGHTLIVVEHDEDTMMEADYIVDIGPGAGVHGGEVVACGTPEEVMPELGFASKGINGCCLSEPIDLHLTEIPTTC